MNALNNEEFFSREALRSLKHTVVQPALTRLKAAALKALDYFLLSLNRLYIHYCIQADSRAKCPACGIRQEHKIRWQPLLEQMVHQCSRCDAVWAQAALVETGKWNAKIQPEPEIEEGPRAPWIDRQEPRTRAVSAIRQ